MPGDAHKSCLNARFITRNQATMNSAEITYVIVSRRCLLLIRPCAPERPHGRADYRTDLRNLEKKNVFASSRKNFLSSSVQVNDGFARLDYVYYVNDIE